MNRKIDWNQELTKAFLPPKPVKKEQFLHELPFPRLSYTGFLFSQLAYIRKRVWGVSIAMILISEMLSFIPVQELGDWAAMKNCWLAAALLPFLVLISVTEIVRSSCYRMAEMEMGCRFSLQQVITARILIIGSMNGIVLLTVLLLMKRISPYGFGRMTVYMIIPYMLACALCLFILNRIRGMEGVYGCAGAACGISILGCLQSVYELRYYYWWLILGAVSIGVIICQLRRLIRQSEEKIKWNLFLTE